MSHTPRRADSLCALDDSGPASKLDDSLGASHAAPPLGGVNAGAAGAKGPGASGRPPVPTGRRTRWLGWGATLVAFSMLSGCIVVSPHRHGHGGHRGHHMQGPSHGHGQVYTPAPPYRGR